MLVLALAVSALAAVARADCDACVAGLCHSRRPIASGFPVTDQLAIDRTNNVLYLQYNNYINMAIFLDDLQTLLVNMMRTSGMAVDRITGALYLGSKDINVTLYEYNLENNRTEAVYNEHSKPGVVVCSIHVDKDNGFRIYKMADRAVYYSGYYGRDYLTDFIITKDKHIFYVYNGLTYQSNLNINDSAHVVSNNNYKLSSDQYGNAYFTDKIQKVIYKWNKARGGLEKYASYTGSLIVDFLFDKEHRIVFRDAGGVAQWVPAPAQQRCAFDPQGGFLIVV